MIKLIALDMDGTVLNGEHVISERNIDAIRAAQANGVEVIISTGRGYPDGVMLVEEAGLNLGFSCMNGAELRNASGEVIHSAPLSSEQSKQVMEILDAENVSGDMYINNFIYTQSIQEQIDMFLRFSKDADKAALHEMMEKVRVRLAEGFIKEVGSFDALIEAPDSVIHKMLALSGDLEKLTNAENKIKELPGICVSSSFVGNLEITHVDGQKGIALEKYAAYKGITLAETMAIGDNYNDVSMMKSAGFSVAMGNAPDDIKAQCDWVTETNVNDGVAVAIEKVLKKIA